ncbi:hypothetical protein VZ95_18050 [Elstera litoralis]|uniref:Major facilitator superfamily (MFS) profile domain-containing protein n=1 Tax=Elstera litoralis TaxID=552518 RepID=A0A0F3INR5_9PROT|nr:MFS transporter [Elstera litoralis]KJV08401.1 hypothetical protein VZ95_18050 [Elstera litoralis]
MSEAAPPTARLVWGLGLGQILAWGSSYYWPALFTAAVAADTGWSPTLIVAGLTVGLLVSGLLARGLGARIARWGPRAVMMAGAGFLAAGLALLALAYHPAVFLIAWGLMGVGMACGLYDAAFATLAMVLHERAPLAIARLTLLGGLASTICWPISHLLIDAIGWRGACLVYTALHLGLVLPLYARVLPKQGTGAVLRGPEAENLASVSRRLMLLLGGVLVLQTIVSVSLAVHLPAVLTETGLTLTQAVAIAAWLGPAQVAARAVQTLLTARLTPLTTLALAVGCVGVGLGLLLLTLTLVPIPGLTLIGVLIYGAGNGLLTIARGTLPLQLFGRDLYARVLGHLAAPSLIAQAIAPMLLTWGLTQVPMAGLIGGLALLAVASLGLTGALAQAVSRR